MATTKAEQMAQVAVLNEQLFGAPVVNPYDAQLSRVDMELARIEALQLTAGHVPGSFFVGDGSRESTMCQSCKNGGFPPDALEGGICVDCGDDPAICAGCKWETKRKELNEDLLCTGCEDGKAAA